MRARIAQAKAAFNKKNRLFLSIIISPMTRNHNLFGVLPYTTVKRERLERKDKQRQWCYRRVLQICWRDGIANEKETVYEQLYCIEEQGY